MDLLSHRLTTLRHARGSVSSGSAAALSAFLTHPMYARCACPARMHPHVSWMLTRARSTSAASEHLLLTQVASAGLATPEASKRARAATRDQLIGPPDRALAGRSNFSIWQGGIAVRLKGVNAMRLSRWLRMCRERR